MKLLLEATAKSQLLLLLLAALAAPALSNVQCPKLAAESICAEAESGFQYNDGCNGVTCSGYGRFETTLKWCPRPSTDEQRRQCRRKLADVMESAGPFTCPNLKAERVCARRGDGFQYNDGCNGVTCDSDGGFASTMRWCPEGDSEGPFCQFQEDQLDQADRRRRRRR